MKFEISKRELYESLQKNLWADFDVIEIWRIKDFTVVAGEGMLAIHEENIKLAASQLIAFRNAIKETPELSMLVEKMMSLKETERNVDLGNLITRDFTRLYSVFFFM